MEENRRSVGALLLAIKRLPVRLMALALAAMALFISLIAISASLRVVAVADSNGAQRLVMTSASSPQAMLEQAGFAWQEEDAVFLAAYGERAYVYVERALPLTVTADGETQTLYAAAATVEDVLERAGISLGEHDYCEPLLHTQVYANMEVTVHRVEYRDTVTEETVPSPIVYKNTPLIRGGRTYVLEEGTTGINEVTYRERVVDGELESAQVVSTVQTLAPTETLVLRRGNVWVSDVDGPAVVNNAPVSYSSVMHNVVTTAYSASRGRGASGLGLYPGTVAVNPSVIPYGTKMFITSADGSFVYGYAIATDTGIALQEGIIGLDLFYGTYRESLLHGKRLLTVYIL